MCQPGFLLPLLYVLEDASMFLPHSRVALCFFSTIRLWTPSGRALLMLPPSQPCSSTDVGLWKCLLQAQDQWKAPLDSLETWWDSEWADLGLKSISERYYLSWWYWFLSVPDQTRLPRLGGLPSNKCGSKCHIFYMPCYTHHFWTSQKPMHFWALAIKHKVLGQAVKSPKWKSIPSPFHGD